MWFPARLQEWETKGTGKIAHKFDILFLLLSLVAEYLWHSSMEVIIKMRPTAAQLTSMGPAPQMRWETFFRPSPDKPMAMIVPFCG